MSRIHYNAESFHTFYEEWLVRQEHYLDELLTVSQNSDESKDEDLKELISRILNHYEEYFEKKSRIAQTNIYLIFSPSWFSSYEKTLLWIGGFRPGLIFHVIKNCIEDLLEEEQTQRIKRLNDDIKIEERVLNDELAKIQERIAAPPLMLFLKRHGRYGHDGIFGEVEEIEKMKGAFQSILASADLLRRDTALKVLEILKPSQTVKLFASWTQFLLTIRASGFEKDAESSGGFRNSK